MNISRWCSSKITETVVVIQMRRYKLLIMNRLFALILIYMKCSDSAYYLWQLPVTHRHREIFFVFSRRTTESNGDKCVKSHCKSIMLNNFKRNEPMSWCSTLVHEQHK